MCDRYDFIYFLYGRILTSASEYKYRYYYFFFTIPRSQRRIVKFLLTLFTSIYIYIYMKPQRRCARHDCANISGGFFSHLERMGVRFYTPVKTFLPNRIRAIKSTNKTSSLSSEKSSTRPRRGEKWRCDKRNVIKSKIKEWWRFVYNIYVYISGERERKRESEASLMKKRVSNMNSFSRSPPRGKESS